MTDDDFEKRLLERFVRYAKVCTTSNKDATSTPTTAYQWDLAHILVDELRSVGVTDITLTDIVSYCKVAGFAR